MAEDKKKRGPGRPPGSKNKSKILHLLLIIREAAVMRRMLNRSRFVRCRKKEFT